MKTSREINRNTGEFKIYKISHREKKKISPKKPRVGCNVVVECWYMCKIINLSDSNYQVASSESSTLARWRKKPDKKISSLRKKSLIKIVQKAYGLDLERNL